MPPDPSPSQGAEIRPPRFGPWLLLLAPTALLVCLGFQKRWTAEDAFIGYRAIDNLLSGHGPVFNLGERVEVFTSPLWIYLLSLLDAPFRLVFEAFGGRDPLEYVAVAAGLVLSGFGVGAATLGSRRLWRAAGDQGLFFPIGALVLASIGVFQDFATSGFETPLSFGWLGGSFLALVLELERQRTAPGRRPCGWTAALFGLGPLVRPDLAIPSALFLGAQLALARPLPWRSLVRTLLAAGALPAAYELFRMGYFGLLLSTTAIAKEASEAYWERGSIYLKDFIDVYVLWIPLALIAREVWRIAVKTARAEELDVGLVVLAPVVSGLIMTFFVTRVGGDYMHGRLLLPSLMALLLPFAAVAGGRAWRLSLIVPWAFVALFYLQPPYVGIGTTGLTDQRPLWWWKAGRKNPITWEDYSKFKDVKDGRELRAQSESARPGETFLSAGEGEMMPGALAVQIPATVVAYRGGVGMTSTSAGPKVWIEEHLGGITNVINSHFRMPRRGRPGHEKQLPVEWFYARFSATPPDSQEVEDARAALGCGDLAELLHATEDPLTPGRFLRNLLLAPKLTRFRISPDPHLARAQLCEGASEPEPAQEEPAPDVPEIGGHMTDPGHKLDDAAKSAVEDQLSAIQRDTEIDVAGWISDVPEDRMADLGRMAYRRWHIGEDWDSGLFFAFPASGRVRIVQDIARPELSPDEVARLTKADDPDAELRGRIERLANLARQLITAKSAAQPRVTPGSMVR